MNKRLNKLTVCIFVLLGVAVVSNGQSTPPQTDTQNWNDVFLSVPVAGPVDFIIQGTIRNGRSITRPVDERLGFGFSIKVGKYLTVIPNYLRIGMQPFAGRRIFENRLSVASTIRFPVGGFIFADRNTFERRLRHPGVDATRYRNRLQIDHPIGPAKKKISLFVSDEVFYEWSFNAWVRNRAAIGMSKVWNKHLTLDLYYLRQNDGHSLPGDLHVIGTAWRFKL
ncbi:MAG TPA: DUF2490 domain-containing protein [Pyrinomonadaceae bacterium]|jgi:hypothetical protein|nr:DUF2490 domain-containing protein [Pyrinomonadaceae bacterium]